MSATLDLDRRPTRGDAALLALLFLAIVAPYAVSHVDDVDSLTYRVVVRHLLEDGTPFRLRYLSTWFAEFREHPPFLFWAWAVLARTLGERALPWGSVLCGTATVVAAYAGGARLVGRRGAFLGGLFLVATESFFRTSANVTLDPALALLFTVSFLLLVNAGADLRLVVLGGLAAGLGALVKGPPALGAPVAAFLALAVLGRRGELGLRRCLLVAALALAPFALFLAVDALALGGSWWRGYVLGQLAGSATGANLDGHAGRLYLSRTLAGRFPHGLPFVALALVLARGPARRERLALLAVPAVVLAGYAIPARAWPWYVLPAYPALALVAGAGLADLLARTRGDLAFAWARRLAGGAAAVTLAALPACTPLTGRRPLGIGPCELGDLAARAAALAPERIALLAPDPWRSSKNSIFTLAEHARRDVVGVSGAAELAARPELDVVLVRRERVPVPPGFTAVASHGRWALAVRDRARTAQPSRSR